MQNSLRQDARQTIREIASQNNIGIATAHKILTENLNMTRVSARWVPRLLTTDADQKRRVSASQVVLKRWQAEGENLPDRIITIDETWLTWVGRLQTS